LPGVSQISVGSTQNLGVAGGYLLPVTFKMLGRTTHAVEWVFNVNNPTALSFEWFRCDTAAANCVPVASANPSPQSYTLTAADAGTRLVVAVTARNAGGSATVSSPPTGVVAAA
jgi:hypothetical protein